MKKLFIAIPEFINNFNVIPQGHTLTIDGQDISLYFHSDLKYGIIDSVPQYNADLVITSNITRNDVLELISKIEYPKVLKLPFASKTEQNLLQAKFLQTNPNDGFLVPKVYKNTTSGPGSIGNGHLEGIYIVKPEAGARGIGQIKIHFNSNVTGRPTAGPNKLTHLLNELKGKNSNGGICNDDIHELLRINFLGSVFSTHGERFQDESAIKLLETLDEGLFIQEYVPDIESEFRIIVGYDRTIRYIQNRGFHTSIHKEPNHYTDYKQAIGSNEVSYAKLDHMFEVLEQKISKSGVEYLERFIKENISPLNSIDLFVTKGGKFGIFEWYSQFGTQGIPSYTNLKLHTDFLTEWIRDAKILETTV